MHKLSRTIIQILTRIVSAAVGFLVVFDVYFLIRTVQHQQIGLLHLHDWWYRAYLFFTLPFTDSAIDIQILRQFAKAPEAIRNDPTVHAFIAGAWSLLIQHIVLFILVIGVIVAFEVLKKGKTRNEIIAFYGLIPATLWLVWLLISPFLP